MDTKLKTRWLADLRSGKYQQAEGELHDYGRDAYCCIGVLCLSVGAAFEDFVDDEGGEFQNVPVLNYENIALGNDNELSFKSLADFGLSTEEQRTLIKMNDDGVSFSVIADYIERNL